MTFSWIHRRRQRESIPAIASTIGHNCVTCRNYWQRALIEHQSGIALKTDTLFVDDFLFGMLQSIMINKSHSFAASQYFRHSITGHSIEGRIRFKWSQILDPVGIRSKFAVLVQYMGFKNIRITTATFLYTDDQLLTPILSILSIPLKKWKAKKNRCRKGINRVVIYGSWRVLGP